MTAEDHPSEERLRRYLDGPRAEPGNPDLEAHLAACAACRGRLLHFYREGRGELAPQAAPAELVARARALAGAAAGRSRLRPWLAAAAALAAAGLALAFWWPGPGPPGATDATRRGEPHADPGVDLVAPPGDAAVGGGPVRFRWRPLPGARRYELLLLDERGDVLAEVSTDAPEATIDLAPLSAAPGARLYWSVSAILADGTRIDSPHGAVIVER